MTLHQAGAGIRELARRLEVSRNTVRDILLARHTQLITPTTALPAVRAPRSRLLAPHEERIRTLLALYPNARPKRVFKILKTEGFEGGHTIVKDYLRRVRPQETKKPVERLETAPGEQSQQDWSPYTVDFGSVSCFSWILSYSRRQYIDFTEREDLLTLMRCHIRGFEHLGGVTPVCLYDNQKAVVLRREGPYPIYNTRFLAFATHYGFRPHALPPRKPQYKGKIERPFWFLETSFFNCRTFVDKADLDAQLAYWLANDNDCRDHGTTGRRPLDLHAEELPALLPLPLHPYDASEIVYRIADVYGRVSWDGNFYSIPPAYVARPLIVRVREADLIVYSAAVEKLTEHELLPRGAGRERKKPEHRVSRSVSLGRNELDVLVEPFLALGPAAQEYLAGLKRVQGRVVAAHVARILGLTRRYAIDDIAIALEHALRYHAHDAGAIERILAFQAPERTLEEPIPLPVREELARWLQDNPRRPRPLAAYQQLMKDAGRLSVPLDGSRQEETHEHSGDHSHPSEKTQTQSHGPDLGPGTGRSQEREP